MCAPSGATEGMVSCSWISNDRSNAGITPSRRLPKSRRALAPVEDGKSQVENGRVSGRDHDEGSGRTKHARELAARRVEIRDELQRTDRDE